MNNVIRTMEKRRSIRKFKPDMPEKEDVRLIAEAGLYAPSGMNRQATVTLVITNKAQGSGDPGGYPTPAARYSTNNCAAAAMSSLSERAVRRFFSVPGFIQASSPLPQARRAFRR